MERRNFVKALSLSAIGLSIIPNSFANILESKVLDSFEDGQEIMFLGDSITHNGRYHTYIDTYYLTRYPERKIKYTNSGISGDNTALVLARMDSDVLKTKPNVVVIMLGMNNTGKNDLYNTNKSEDQIDEARLKLYETFETEYLKIISILKNHCNPKFILLTPTAYDETVVSDVPALIGKNKTLSEIANIVRKIATKEKYELIEYYNPYSELNARLQANDPKFSLANKDRVNPPLQTHLYLGYLFLKSRKASNLVSKIKIDAEKLKYKDCTNATVTNFNKSANEITFDCLENSLPFPVKPYLKEVLVWVPFEQDLNQELLIVENLSAGSYDLLIDGIKISTINSEDLTKGVNLAAMTNTPQYKQAMSVYDACIDYANKCSILRKIVSAKLMIKRDNMDVTDESKMAEYKANKIAYNKYYEEVFREYDKTKDQENPLADVIDAAYQKMYSLNKPQTHKFSLVKVA